MSRPKRWVEEGIQNGIGEIRFKRWRYFMEYVQDSMLDYPSYIWRGQRSSTWKLESTYYRTKRQLQSSRAAKKAKKKPAVRSLVAHLDEFKYAVRGRRGPHPAAIESDNEWWALGQHHGLATPLIDWTSSPFVAAYFSFFEDGAQLSEYRTVWALHRPSIETRVKELIKEAKARQAEEQKTEDEARRRGESVNELASVLRRIESRPEVEFVRPLSDENHRLVSQSGQFTYVRDGIPLDEWVEKQFKGDGVGYTLMKLLIPDAERQPCLRMLNRMNINHLSLFPDLPGASQFCNLRLQLGGGY